jgi:death on curing protein
MDIRFLTLQEIKNIHFDQIKRFGGMKGIRDEGLLDSAVNGPQATFAGKFLYEDIFDMAAALAYGIIKNHPFFDGNKRVGMITSIVFLGYHNYLIPENDALYQIILNVATSKISMEELAKFYRENSSLLF